MRSFAALKMTALCHVEVVDRNIAWIGKIYTIMRFFANAQNDSIPLCYRISKCDLKAEI